MPWENTPIPSVRGSLPRAEGHSKLAGEDTWASSLTNTPSWPGDAAFTCSREFVARLQATETLRFVFQQDTIPKYAAWATSEWFWCASIPMVQSHLNPNGNLLTNLLLLQKFWRIAFFTCVKLAETLPEEKQLWLLDQVTSQYWFGRGLLRAFSPAVPRVLPSVCLQAPCSWWLDEDLPVREHLPRVPTIKAFSFLQDTFRLDFTHLVLPIAYLAWVFRIGQVGAKFCSNSLFGSLSLLVPIGFRSAGQYVLMFGRV